MSEGQTGAKRAQIGIFARNQKIHYAPHQPKEIPFGQNSKTTKTPIPQKKTRKPQKLYQHTHQPLDKMSFSRKQNHQKPIEPTVTKQ